MKPQRERSDGVSPFRLGAVSSSFRAHGKERRLPVSDECWMVHQAKAKKIALKGRHHHTGPSFLSRSG